MESGGIDHVLARARRGLQRLTAVQAYHAVRRGALLVDTRPEFQRAADGEIPGGFQSWRTSGLPVVHPPVPTAPRRPGT
ncbi:hypothetical protein Psi02_67100 [Planotetraspora silvatica]|uniref:Rhodanese domain-containing protein n=1 Tax=Planotetraspora silvatica TaxID=234614 RepID=A0A8J3XSA0_9ACTN|nr:hypothetical protein [Planotetraspora silvatica]GII50286.1 hypothetical protein Psi02_67100 [Planotetraspora silvatica]